MTTEQAYRKLNSLANAMYGLAAISVPMQALMIYSQVTSVSEFTGESMLDVFGPALYIQLAFIAVLFFFNIGIIIYGAHCMKQHKRYQMCKVAGVVSCIAIFPFSIIVGVMVLSHLGEKSVKALFEE